MQILAEYTYAFPRTVEEAVLKVKQGATIMAGGSDLMPQLKMGLISPKDIADLGRIDGLKGISIGEDGIRIGSMTTLDAIARDEGVLQVAPILSQAARNVASPQIRNRGTIGGNLLQSRRCFYYNQTAEWREGIPVCRKLGGDICLQMRKSPTCRAIYYSDMAPALVALNAVAELVTEDGTFNMPVEELVRLHCEDTLGAVFITALFIPCQSYAGAYASFSKYSLRGSIDFPIINFSAVQDASGVVRFTVGAIATTVLRLEALEAYLQASGRSFDLEHACAIAVEEMGKKCQLIRESGISIPVKKSAFLQVRGILEKIRETLNQQ